MPARPPKTLPPRLKDEALADRIAVLRGELEVLEAHQALAAKLAADARLRAKQGKPPLLLPKGEWYTIEEAEAVLGVTRQSVHLYVVRRTLRSLQVRCGKTGGGRKRRLVFIPDDWNKEH
jgi:hypothetical protein